MGRKVKEQLAFKSLWSRRRNIKMNQYINDYTLKWNGLKTMKGTKCCENIEKEEISYE